MVLFSLFGEQNFIYSQISSSIPEIRISTDKEVSDVSTIAHFQLIEHGQTNINNSILIRLRGASTRSYPKKSYRIEFIKENEPDKKLNVSVLGMRNDDDWNLDAIYNEPLRINTSVSNELWLQIANYNSIAKQTAKYGIDTRYAFLYINNTFQGIYLLTERIDRKQLQIDTDHGELYKYKDHTDGTLFKVIPPYSNNSDYWAGIKWKYPKDFIDWSNLYEYAWFVTHSDEPQFIEEYLNKLDVANLTDYYIFINTLGLIDNTDKNIYLAKDDAFSPYYYVPWDLDGSLGFSWDGSFSVSRNAILTSSLFKRLIMDCHDDGFVKKIKSRWNELRIEILNTENIYQLIDKNFNYLSANDVFTKEENRWHDYTFRNELLSSSKTWLQERIDVLDTYFDNLCTNTSVNDYIFQDQNLFILSPNPAVQYINLTINNPNNQDTYQLSIYNSAGREVYRQAIHSTTKIFINHLQKGIYMLKLEGKYTFKTEKLIIQ